MTDYLQALRQSIDEADRERRDALDATEIRYRKQMDESFRVASTIADDWVKKAETLRRRAADRDSAPVPAWNEEDQAAQSEELALHPARSDTAWGTPTADGIAAPGDEVPAGGVRADTDAGGDEAAWLR